MDGGGVLTLCPHCSNPIRHMHDKMKSYKGNEPNLMFYVHVEFGHKRLREQDQDKMAVPRRAQGILRSWLFQAPALSAAHRAEVDLA